MKLIKFALYRNLLKIFPADGQNEIFGGTLWAEYQPKKFFCVRWMGTNMGWLYSKFQNTGLKGVVCEQECIKFRYFLYLAHRDISGNRKLRNLKIPPFTADNNFHIRAYCRLQNHFRFRFLTDTCYKVIYSPLTIVCITHTIYRDSYLRYISCSIQSRAIVYT